MADEVEQTNYAAAARPGLMTAAAIYGAANLITAAIPLLLLPIFVRVLSPGDFGQIAMFSVVQAILVPVQSLGGKSAIVREYYAGSLAVPSLIGTALVILLAMSVAIAGLVLLAGRWLTPFLQLSVGWIMLAVLASAAQFIISVRLSLWQAAQSVLPYVSFQILMAMCNAAISLYLVLAMDLRWQGRVLGVAMALCAFSVIAFLQLRKQAEIRWAPSWRD